MEPVGNMSTGMDSSSANQEKEDFSVFHLVEFANMSYPTWTHDQYAFATIKEEGLQGHNGNNTALGLNARIPALRGNLNCSLANYYTRQNLSEHSPGGRIITVQPPSGCRTPRENLTEGRLVWLSFVDEPEADYEVRYLQDVYPGKSFNYSSTEGRTTPGTVCGDNRQHFWYIAGSSTNGDWDDITLIHCVPYIEALLVNVSFFLPEFQIDTSAPIIPDEASATPFSNESSAGYIGSDFEHFSQALENGTHGTPFSELTGIANAAKFIERVDSLYRVWTAQSLHFYFRHPAALPLPANTTNDPAAAHFATDPFRAVLTDRTRLRLVQSEVSTRILQGVLLALALCVALAFVLEPRTRLLPRDPGSVAAKMSLFADGRVWRSVPEGAETWGDGEMESRGLLRDVLFRMGWWGGEMEEGGGRRWFGVDGEEERDG
ncbi:hypothetical protein SLS55_002000 [Diplodia seriata]|uniref:Uncharacterized protein n=1 Tax=Diplodia seriata TaxID=420778 RepID=A0ABR3CRY6_9PEZI